MELRKFITKTINEYLNEQKGSKKELEDFSSKDNTYYHGTSNDIDAGFTSSEKIKEFGEYDTNWSKNIQGLGKFYTSSILNAYSFIDFRKAENGNIIEIYYNSVMPYDVKNIVKLMKILDDYGDKNNINSITERNQMFVNYLINEGYDSIVFKEGPSHNPNSKKFSSKVIIPLVRGKIKITNRYIAKSRNGGIYYI